jgi:hypothetical protein
MCSCTCNGAQVLRLGEARTPTCNSPPVAGNSTCRCARALTGQQLSPLAIQASIDARSLTTIYDFGIDRSIQAMCTTAETRVRASMITDVKSSYSKLGLSCCCLLQLLLAVGSGHPHVAAHLNEAFRGGSCCRPGPHRLDAAAHLARARLEVPHLPQGHRLGQRAGASRVLACAAQQAAAPGDATRDSPFHRSPARPTSQRNGVLLPVWVVSIR